jgi:hypothetical protein
MDLEVESILEDFLEDEDNVDIEEKYFDKKPEIKRVYLKLNTDFSNLL